MKPVPSPRAIFGVSKHEVPGVIARALAMHDGWVASAALFGSPAITMVAFLALITALVDAQQYAKNTGAKGSASMRNTKRDAVWTAMGTLRTQVQGWADVATADNAVALIEAAGLLVAGSPSHQKALLSATLTAAPGVAHLAANATALLGKGGLSKKATFHWQRSDNGGKSWEDAGATPYASTDVTGLALMTTYAFRVSVTVGKSTGAWSQVLPTHLVEHLPALELRAVA
jgi:hypothetical protein